MNLKNNLIIREAEISDQEKVTQLQAKYGIQADSLNDWDRIWFSNPDFSINSPIGWVLEDNGKIVGYLGNVPSTYYWRKIKLTARSARGWVVDINFRNYSIYLILKYLSQKGVDLLINSSSNKPAFKIFISLGCNPPKGFDFSQSNLWVINPSKLVSAIFMRFSPNIFIQRSIFFFMKIFFYLHKLISFLQINFLHFLYKNEYKDFHFKFIDVSDENYNLDILFHKLLNKNHGFLADRSAEKIKWYCNREYSNIKIVGCFNSNILIGYAMVSIKNIYNTNICKAELTDFISLNLNHKFIRLMLMSAIKLFKNWDIAFFEINPNSGLIKAGSSYLFSIKRSRFPTPFTYKLVNRTLFSLCNYEEFIWSSITNYDGDSGL